MPPAADSANVAISEIVSLKASQNQAVHLEDAAWINKIMQAYDVV